MKKLFLSIIMGVLTIVTDAQTIHWLTFIDTEDANVGKLDVTGRNVLYSRFVNVVNAALHDVGYKSDIHDIYDSALSPEKCKSEVQNLLFLSPHPYYHRLRQRKYYALRCRRIGNYPVEHMRYSRVMYEVEYH